ncbi:MAG: sigma-70 family RNA polymerase sigma factor [Bacteroidales bacterium]|nr:sigma-70 family RNA polymerase sigma factor [Bacteroidales bacterium]
MNNTTDIELMQLVVKGDETALSTLIERYRERLYRLAYSLLGDSAAEDAVQETFIRLWTRARRYNPRHSLATWLYTLCCRRCYDELRRRRRHHEALMQLPENMTEVSSMEADELLVLLSQVTATLPPKQRIVYQLREVEGFGAEETATIARMTPEQVKANLWAARATVKEKLKQYGI